MGLEVKSKIVNGKMNPECRKLIADKIQELEGQNVRFILKRASPSSLRQYGYLFAVIYPQIKHRIEYLEGLKNNYSIDDIDLMMKLKFHSKEMIDHETGEVVKIPLRKRWKNKRQLSEYMDSCIKWAHEYLDIKISEPSHEYDAVPYEIIST